MGPNAPEPEEIASDLRYIVGQLARRTRERDIVTLSTRLAETLSYLDREGPMTTSELAERHSVRQQSMAAKLAELDAHGYLERQPHPTDRRKILIAISQHGSDRLNDDRRRRVSWLAEAITDRLDTHANKGSRQHPLATRPPDRGLTTPTSSATTSPERTRCLDAAKELAGGDCASVSGMVHCYHGTDRARADGLADGHTLKVLKAVARYLDLSLGDLVEGIVLHVFEGQAPFSAEVLGKIEELKAVYGVTLTAADAHTLTEEESEMRQRLSHRIHIALSAEAAFQLFTPRGEREWAPGWDPTFPAPSSDDSEPGTVFETEAHGHRGTWLVTDRVWGRQIAYAQVIPGPEGRSYHRHARRNRTRQRGRGRVRAHVSQRSGRAPPHAIRRGLHRVCAVVAGRDRRMPREAGRVHRSRLTGRLRLLLLARSKQGWTPREVQRPHIREEHNAAGGAWRRSDRKAPAPRLAAQSGTATASGYGVRVFSARSRFQRDQRRRSVGASLRGVVAAAECVEQVCAVGGHQE